MASGGWSFLKVLENPSTDSKKLDQNDTVYVHPMVKRSASALSTKSLEMCTESLGSETGSDVSESGDEFCALSLEERERLRAIQRSKYRSFDRKIRRNDFPPPLNSISSSDGALKVRHHREGGRLVIKAESFSNCGTSFQAERINGRLKLSLLKGCNVNYESEGDETESCESEGGEMGSYESEGGEIENFEEGGSSEEEEEEGGDLRCDINGNRWTMGGSGELKMLTRCKEGGNGNKVFANWGSCRVAIS
ncbi:putative The fantastic four family protein [Helianthus annuus]|uniref:Putative the fantastic four family n=1 Tax=Helianthus annuus TaxID=4232 RepID=A0A251TIT9_HELAN|nr:protein FANTASTIC FOUR 1 [Helianthus annuus]KAF5782456.1 putative The fantastic four family protein [Helianthus annuus]KAJ0501937.1 putative The fantastic four family protein [Helianthus annuus]KAJ0509875.1 putative The fantastic four family protein [Helianthus annuus]KAJ0517864.1 putative The fantastic four family protein [Helianthus annuus]KAJ0685880.1 putative The fantastic four family protein [Helianthus annuus]